VKQQNDTSSNDNLEENQNEKSENKDTRFKKTIKLKRKDNNIDLDGNIANDEDLSNDSQDSDNEVQNTDKGSKEKGSLSFNLPNKQNKNLTLNGDLEEKSDNDEELDISPPIKRKKDSHDISSVNTNDNNFNENQSPTKTNIQPELIGTLPTKINSVNNNQEKDYSPEELDALIQQGKKKQALEILGNMALDVVRAEKAIKALNYLRNNGALDNDESDKIYNSARKTIKKGPPTPNKIIPQNNDINNGEINNNDANDDNTLVHTTPNTALNKSLPKPDTVSPTTAAGQKEEDSSPHQEVSRVAPPPHSKSIPKEIKENTQQKTRIPKEKPKSKGEDEVKNEVKNAIEKAVLSIFLNPTTYIILFIIIIIVVITISITHIVICIQGFTTNQTGVCHDVTSMLGSAMIEKMKDSLNTFSDFLNNILSKISSSIPTDNTDIADNIDQIRNSGLDQEI